MQIKKVYELTAEDLEGFPVWYFPMDDADGDELSICPVTSEAELESDHQIVVLTRFVTAAGRPYIGYLYWCDPSSVQYTRPVMLMDGADVSFWNGRRRPVLRDFANLSDSDFPICFKSEDCFGLIGIEGILEGIYFFEGHEIICERPGERV